MKLLKTSLLSNKSHLWALLIGSCSYSYMKNTRQPRQPSSLLHSSDNFLLIKSLTWKTPDNGDNQIFFARKSLTWKTPDNGDNHLLYYIHQSMNFLSSNLWLEKHQTTETTKYFLPEKVSLEKHQTTETTKFFAKKSVTWKTPDNGDNQIFFAKKSLTWKTPDNGDNHLLYYIHQLIFFSSNLWLEKHQTTETTIFFTTYIS